jgi:hypothetical protein
MKELPKHLGGHSGVTHVDSGTLKYFRYKYNIKSMIDVGCGPGGQVAAAKKLDIDALGVDGDHTIHRDIPFVLHDYTKGFLNKNVTNRDSYDLAWCVEFLEHIGEEYIPNVMDTLIDCKIVVCTHALPGCTAPHHVNLQSEEYWINKFNEYGFKLSVEDTNAIRKETTMTREFINRTGKVFLNTELLEGE